MLSSEVFNNYISPVGLSHAIFRLTDFSSHAFDFSSSETSLEGSAQWALRSPRACQHTRLQVCDSQNLFWRLLLMLWRAVYRNWAYTPPHPRCPHHPTRIPTPAHRSGRKGPVQPNIPLRPLMPFLFSVIVHSVNQINSFSKHAILRGWNEADRPSDAIMYNCRRAVAYYDHCLCGSLSFKGISDVFPQRMLIDQSNYRVPKTLMVPKTEAQTGVETPCIPFNYNIHHPNTASGSKEGTEHRIF